MRTILKRRPGFALIVVLLIISLLLILGIGYIGRGVARYRAVRDTAVSSQARAIAIAGLEETRVKMDKDYYFPPQSAIDQQRMSFSERVTDLSGQVVGIYVVTLSWVYEDDPYNMIILRSQGQVIRDGKVVGRRTIEAEFRDGPYEMLVIRDLGSF